MTTTVFPCPKCRGIVRLREGESSVQCTQCGATVAASAGAAAGTKGVHVASSAGEPGRQVVVVTSLLALAAGLATLATMRRPKTVHQTDALAATPTPIYTAPPRVPVVPTPAGEIAWEPTARAPIFAAINADATEDIFGFFRVWDGLSAWVVYAGAFDGATLKELWRTDMLDPQIVKQPTILPLALVAGSRVVVADTSPTLRVYTLASGQKETTLQLGGSVAELCLAPDAPDHVWVKVAGDSDATLDLKSGKSTLAPRPKWCPVPAYRASPTTPPATPGKALTTKQAAEALQSAKDTRACTSLFTNDVLAHARCRAPEGEGDGPSGFRAGYVLTDGSFTVALGTKDARPFAESRMKASPWIHAFVTDDTKPKPLTPAVTELASGRLYAVYEKVYFDARLVALDARNGESLWESPLVGSVTGPEGAVGTSRGDARALVTTATRVYVVRLGGGLDVFEAASGKSIGTIGKQ